MNPRALMRRDLLALDVYPPPAPIRELEQRLGRRVVKLDANENSYGPSPLVAAALHDCCAERYPDPDSTQLREMLGRHVGTDPARIVCSAGGDEMLDLLLRLFLEPGDEVVDLTPSFVMYELSTVYNRGTVLRVPRTGSFAVDVDALEQALTERTRVIFLCNPNNPTGNSVSREVIVRVLDLGRMVVLDEAYAEFAGFSHVDLCKRYPNLIILRTMSKWAALAGLRLGYAIVDPAIVHEMKKIKSPYNVSAAAQAAGVASLTDTAYLMSNVSRIVRERDRLYHRLAELEYGAVFPSETNFLYWQTGPVSAPALKQALAEQGVLVRALRDPVDALRFSVGTPEESDIVVDVLQQVYPRLAG